MNYRLANSGVNHHFCLIKESIYLVLHQKVASCSPSNNYDVFYKAKIDYNIIKFRLSMFAVLCI